MDSKIKFIDWLTKVAGKETPEKEDVLTKLQKSRKLTTASPNTSIESRLKNLFK